MWPSPMTSEMDENALAGGEREVAGTNLEDLWSGRGGEERTYVNQEGRRLRDVETKAGQ